MLLIKCKDCGKEVPAGYQQDRQSFEVTNFTEQLEKCPNCGNIRPYFKANYFLKKVEYIVISSMSKPTTKICKRCKTAFQEETGYPVCDYCLKLLDNWK